MAITSRTQLRISWRDSRWLTNKPTAVRLFKHRALAEEFVHKLLAESPPGVVSVVAEEREMSTSPWRPSDLGGAK